MKMSDTFVEKMSAIDEWCAPYVGMLILLPSREASPVDVLGNGTASFIDTGERRFIVTCEHVYRAFEEERQRNPNACLGITGDDCQPLNITDSHRVIARGRSGLDLMTMELIQAERADIIAKSYFKCLIWPPPRPQEDDVAFFVGFPGIHRESSERGLETRTSPFCDTITSVSRRHFVLVDEELERRTSVFNETLTAFGPLGGVSGAACYIQSAEDATQTLVGFVYESDDGVHATFFVHHADFINADGTIRSAEF